MTNVDRRRFVSSISAIAACTAAAPTIGHADAGAPLKARFSDARDLDWGWYIARQQLDHRPAASRPIQNAVDFWTKPLSTISLIDHLPPEISSGVLWFDGFSRGKTRSERLEYIDTAHAKISYEWIEPPRSVATCSNDIDQLSFTLRSLIPEDRPAYAASRTALLDLTSTSLAPNEPEWAQIIPALAPCYDLIIGHYHLKERGFRHFTALLDQWMPEEKLSLHNAASLCDAVIFTSASLIETDTSLTAKASTEVLVGQLTQQLGYALLDENALKFIGPAREKRLRGKPRAFALGSVTSTAGHSHVDFRTLTRQRELVFGCFGDLLRRPIQPLLIATLADGLSSHVIREQIQGTDFLFLRVANSDRLQGGDPLEPIHLITLWPFDAEFASHVAT